MNPAKQERTSGGRGRGEVSAKPGEAPRAPLGRESYLAVVKVHASETDSVSSALDQATTLAA